MSFGSSSPPAPQPKTPIPQDDDPKSFETQRKAALMAKDREGDSAHLLTGTSTDTDSKRKVGSIY